MTSHGGQRTGGRVPPRAAVNGPMTVESLRDAGIEAVSHEAFDAVTARHAVQVKVPRRQHQEATELLDSLRGP